MEDTGIILRGYEDYSITKEGRLYSHKSSMFMQESDNQAGYMKFTLCVNFKDKKYKNMYVHRLVAQYFIPNEEGHKYVGHKDHNRSNNHVDNLYWTTASGNTRDGVRDGKINQKGRYKNNKMDKHSIDVIRSCYFEVKQGGCGVQTTATKYGVNRTTLSSWLNKRSLTEFTNEWDKLINKTT